MPETTHVTAAGGPLIALPSCALGGWGGVDSLLPGSEAEVLEQFSPSPEPTDYDRACSVAGWAQVLSIGGGQGLVLDLVDEPGPTVCWVPRPWGGVFFAGCIEDYDDEAEEVRVLEAEAEWTVLGAFSVEGGALLVASAALPGQEFAHDDHLRVRLEPGSYEVAVAEYGVAEAVGVRLRRRPSP